MSHESCASWNGAKDFLVCLLCIFICIVLLCLFTFNVRFSYLLYTDLPWAMMTLFTRLRAMDGEVQLSVWFIWWRIYSIVVAVCIIRGGCCCGCGWFVNRCFESLPLKSRTDGWLVSLIQLRWTQSVVLRLVWFAIGTLLEPMIIVLPCLPNIWNRGTSSHTTSYRYFFAIPTERP